MGAITHNGKVLQSLPANASQINFDKTGTNLNSTQVENAIKEVNTKVNTNTTDIDQLKNGLTDSNMVPVNTITLGTIATNENQKSFMVTKNGYVTVDSGNVGATNPTVTCSVVQIAKNYGAATTVTIAAYTGVKFCTVPVKAGDLISVYISGHTVEASVLQISYS